MANHNVKPRWKKGESGNPAGMPKGYKQIGPVLTKFLNGTMTVEEAGKRLKRSRTEVMALTLINDAINPRNTASERTRACQAIMDRIEGRPVQPLGAAPKTAINITISPDEDRV
jgi:hypothetical protein